MKTEKYKVLKSFLGFLFTSSFIASVIEYHTGVNALLIEMALIAFLLVARIVAGKKGMIGEGVALAGIQVEVWNNYIVEKFMKVNGFLNNVRRADDNVLNGAVVHIPQAGALPETIKNRTTFPAVAVKRTDTDITYPLDTYTTTPTHIQDAEQKELSYNKMDSVLGGHIANIAEVAADDLIIKWGSGVTSATSKIKTTGATTAATAPGATTNVKLVTSADILAMQTLFNQMNVPIEDRYAMLPASMYGHLMQTMSDTQYRDFTRVVDAQKGVVGELFGFKIIQRSRFLILDSTGAVKPLGSTSATTDFEAALFFQKDSLEFALGEVNVYENVGDALYYGNVYSASLRGGGRVRRSDGAGVALLTQL